MSRRDDHERAIFLQAFNPPGDPDDLSQPFDTDRLMSGFAAEPERIIHAAGDPVLDGLAVCAEAAWAAFLAADKTSE